MRCQPSSSFVLCTSRADEGGRLTERSSHADVLEDLQVTDDQHEHYLDVGKGKEKQEPMDADMQLALALLVDEAFSDYSRRYSFLDGDFQSDSHARMFQDYLATQLSPQAVDTLNLLSPEWTAFLPSSAESSLVGALPSFRTISSHPEETTDNAIANPSMVYQVPANCAVCRENITGKVTTLHCGHRYDVDCLKNMFSANVDDEYRFPPRCCGQVIPLSRIEDDLSQETLELYNAKIAEYQTPTRLYCSNKQCAKFMGPRQQQAVAAKCSSCSAETCALCTSPAHAATVRCTVDKGLRKALKLGQSCGWQRCPRCRQLVERNNGCYHMSCRCGAQFCYLCAAEWKSCGCTGGTNRFLRLIGARKLRFRGNYLVKGELGSNGEGSLTRLCRKSWRGVVDIVTPASKVSA